MKRLTLIFTTALAASLLCLAVARAATNYNNAVGASRTASADRDDVSLILDATGDLPGMGKITLRREGNNVTGGSWSLTVLPPNADATSSEKGRLTGAVSGGSVTFNPDGTLAGVSGVQLIVEGGTGEHASVSGGSGTLILSADAENPSKLKGTLALNF
ncbi:MAG: hypothetical protein ABW208_15090 [Pyrinomonadaceae bacterium]